MHARRIARCIVAEDGRAGTWAIKPHAVQQPGSSNTYSYDCNGNMTGRAIGGVVYTLTYDAENRLTGISGGGVTASYTYDGRACPERSLSFRVVKLPPVRGHRAPVIREHREPCVRKDTELCVREHMEPPIRGQ